MTFNVGKINTDGKWEKVSMSQVVVEHRKWYEFWKPKFTEKTFIFSMMVKTSGVDVNNTPIKPNVDVADVQVEVGVAPTVFIDIPDEVLRKRCEKYYKATGGQL